MAQRANARAGQQQSSHMLKTGKRGSPFMKDTHDLFATLIVSLPLATNQRFFRSYHHTFTTDDAAANLAQLRFSQSNRTQDPADPNRIITTTTTTTFSMTRDIAKGICQHFMDAHLIANAIDIDSNSFKDRGIYKITPKGMHILERFITKNGIAGDHLIEVFKAVPISLKLLHLERMPLDDEINISRKVVDLIWRRLAGERKPNYFIDPAECAKGREGTYEILEGKPRPSESFDRGQGVEVQDILERSRSGAPNVVKYVFHSYSAIDYLLDYATISCREEAAEVLAHCVRYGYIALYSDRTKTGDKYHIAHGPAPAGEPAAASLHTGDYRYGPKICYRMTEEGRKLTAWEPPHGTGAAILLRKVRDTEKVSSDGSNGHDDDASSTKSGIEKRINPSTAVLGSNASVADLFRLDLDETSNSAAWNKDGSSSYTRLQAILGDHQLKLLFRDYLKAGFCDENLSFWLDVNEFRQKFRTTSSAISTNPVARKRGNEKAQSAVSNAMELHSQSIVASALMIYNTYLAPFSPSELNIDHSLRKEVVEYMTSTVNSTPAPSGKPAINPTPSSMNSGPLPAPVLEPEDLPPLKASQIQTLLKMYERIQDHVFRLLATDQVPKFIRTPKFMELIDVRSDEESRRRGSPRNDEKPKS
ncbi:regulator of G protein signaling superfamily [Atractiella rhizophila]|nr:regulator of G protein signaling superfamily [Atractiella rhizophila]